MLGREEDKCTRDLDVYRNTGLSSNRNNIIRNAHVRGKKD